MHTGLACVRLSGCQRVVEPPPCPSYIPSDRCLQSFETYRRLNATPRSPLHGCTQPTLLSYPFLQPHDPTPHRAAGYKSGQARSFKRARSPPIPSVVLRRLCPARYTRILLPPSSSPPLSYYAHVRRDRDSISMMFACNSIVDRQRAWPRQRTTLDRPSSINHLDDPGGKRDGWMDISV